MDRRKDLLTFLFILPFVAFVPVLFPQPQYDWRQVLFVFAYLSAAAIVARLVASHTTRA